MKVLQRLIRPAAIGLAVLLCLPIIALVPAAFLDRGPGGAVRVSPFPLALLFYDPFVRLCVGRSLVCALAVALLALTAGTGLAHITARHRFWGRPTLAALGWAAVVIPPYCLALGLRLTMSRLAPQWLGDSSTREFLWLLAELVPATALVALAVHGALVRIHPAWDESARAAGGRALEAWRSLTWPLIRPAAQRAALATFSLTLLEPGAPLVLGLRRTLPFQLVEAATTAGARTRLAGLSLIALALIVAVYFAVRRRLHGRVDGPEFGGLARSRRHSRAWSLLLGIALAAWALAAWGPLVALAAVACAAGPGDMTPTSAVHGLMAARSVDSVILHVVASSLFTGAIAATVALGLACLVSWITQGASQRAEASVPGAFFPPLLLGAGFLALSWLLGFGPLDSRASDSAPAYGRLLRALSERLDPYRAPGVSLVGALALVHLPFLAKAFASARGEVRRNMIDAALLLGSPPLRARTSVAVRLVASRVGYAWLLAAVLSAHCVAPALLLAPVLEDATTGVVAVVLADEPAGQNRAALLALFASALNVTAFALTARVPGGVPRAELRA